MGRDGARVAEKIFQGWALLLSQGPTLINLKGPYEELSASGRAGRYSQLILQRRTVVKKLGILAANCNKVRRSAGDIFLWHEGV